MGESLCPQGSNHMKVLRRRDEFLKLLSQSKTLKYPDRSVYYALDKQARDQVRFRLLPAVTLFNHPVSAYLSLFKISRWKPLDRPTF